MITCTHCLYMSSNPKDFMPTPKKRCVWRCPECNSEEVTEDPSYAVLDVRISPSE